MPKCQVYHSVCIAVAELVEFQGWHLLRQTTDGTMLQVARYAMESPKKKQSLRLSSFSALRLIKNDCKLKITQRISTNVTGCSTDYTWAFMVLGVGQGQFKP